MCLLRELIYANDIDLLDFFHCAYTKDSQGIIRKLYIDETDSTYID